MLYAVDATRRLLAKVRSGELGRPPRAEVPSAASPDEPPGVRSGWL